MSETTALRVGMSDSLMEGEPIGWSGRIANPCGGQPLGFEYSVFRVSDFVRETMADGSRRVDLTRLTDGSVMCCVCFEYIARTGLARDSQGDLTDVCIPCSPKVRL